MSNFPAQIDDTVSLPISHDNISGVNASVANGLRTAILAVESALGIAPAGIYSTVRNRFDALESLIASEGGFVAGGDLAGGGALQTVIGLQGRPISSTAPTNGQVLAWDGAEWAPTTQSVSSFTAGGDLSGSSTNQTVIAIQGNAIQSGALGSSQDGYVLTWNNGASRWEAEIAASGSGFTAGGDLSGTNTTQEVVGLFGFPLVNTNDPSPFDTSAVPVWDYVSSKFEIRAANYGDIATAAVAAGDLSGSLPNPTVVALQGNAVQASAPSDGNVLTWKTADNQWEPIAPNPTSLDGYSIVFTGPQAGQVLTYNGTDWVNGNWLTALDLDFTVLGNQVFIADGTYTIGGKTFNKINTIPTLPAVNHVSIGGFTVPPHFPPGPSTQVTVSTSGAQVFVALNYCYIPTAGVYQVISIGSGTMVIQNPVTQTWSNSNTSIINAVPTTPISPQNAYMYPVIVQGTGLIMQSGEPGASTRLYSNERTLPAFTISISSLIPTFAPQMNLRALMHTTSADPVTDTNAVVVALEAPSNYSYYALRTLHSTTLQKQLVATYNGLNGGAATIVSTGATANGDNVLVLETTNGFTGGNAVAHGGTWSSGWPAYTSLDPLAVVRWQDTTPHQFYIATTAVGPASGYDMLIGVEVLDTGGATGYSATIANIRLEWRV